MTNMTTHKAFEILCEEMGISLADGLPMLSKALDLTITALKEHDELKRKADLLKRATDYIEDIIEKEPFGSEASLVAIEISSFIDSLGAES